MRLVNNGSYGIRKAFQMGLYLVVLALSGFSTGFSTGLQAHEHSNNHLGYHLETDFWVAVQHQDVKAIEKKSAPIFQGNAQGGIYTRQQQIAGLTIGVELISFSLENFVTTRNNDVIINTYDFVSTSTGLVDGPVVSVWVKGKHNWKMVSQAYFPFPSPI